MTASAERTPLRIRIGVTGHRALSDEPTVSDRVDAVLSRVQALERPTPTTPVAYEVVSPLGEGADRIVAERVLALPGAILEAPLPLDRDEYERDFGSEESRRHFEELLQRAERVWVVGGSDRDDAYQQAGAYVVDSCDLLIAIWDGEPSRGKGGTGDILELARGRKMPAFVIDARPPYDVHEERIPPTFGLVREVDEYNRIDVTGSSNDASPLLPASEDGLREADGFAPFLSWVELPFRRADTIAGRYRRRFLATSRLMFLMSALATFAVAASVAVNDRAVARTFAYLEVGLMLAALVLWLLVRRRLHGRWITSRFLAERLRSAAFLAFLGSDDVMEVTPEGRYRGNTHEWLSRVFREIRRARPKAEPPARALEDIQLLLQRAWVDPQVAYYRRRSQSHAAAVGFLTAASASLLATAVVAAALHASDAAHGSLSAAVVVLSIGLPALAGALSGIAALEQHPRHAERFALMARRLTELSDDLGRATSIDRVRRLAMRIEAELRREGDAWIDVMRYQDVDLPAR